MIRPHLTPRYVLDRTRQIVYQRRHPDAPWLTAAMVGLLDEWLKPGDVGLEWGSGRSTLWFGRRLARLVSIEHDAEWGQRVRGMIAGAGLGDRVDHRVLSKSGRDGVPPYVAAAGEFADASLDFVLVDGKMRDACALAALPKLKPGGIILIDNVERYLPRRTPSAAPGARRPADGCASSEWQRFADQVEDWRRFWTSNGVFDTALWQKPGS